jgi:hypothetical protein
VFTFGCPRIDAENLEMEVVLFLSHGKSETMVHPFGRSMSGDWEKLRVDFCSSFSLLKHINYLLMDILDFEQLEKESLGAAWARLLRLLVIYPHLSIPEGLSLYIFLSCLEVVVVVAAAAAVVAVAVAVAGRV